MVTVTLAPGTSAPVASVTVPAIALAVVFWAEAESAQIARIADDANIKTGSLMMPPRTHTGQRAFNSEANIMSTLKMMSNRK